jgi:hypothetical protein
MPGRRVFATQSKRLVNAEVKTSEWLSGHRRGLQEIQRANQIRL